MSQQRRSKAARRETVEWISPQMPVFSTKEQEGSQRVNHHNCLIQARASTKAWIKAP
jgi:hypothetical protein